MRSSRRIATTAGFFLALFAASTVYAACNQQQAIRCRAAYFQCSREAGSNPDDECEIRYSQCLQNAGCPIP